MSRLTTPGERGIKPFPFSIFHFPFSIGRRLSDFYSATGCFAANGK